MLNPALLLLALAAGGEFPRFEAQEIDPHVGEVCYAVTIADVNGDGKPDVVALSEDAVAWYANPTWERHVLLKGQTARDNVCIQPHDIDGDGKVDFALGAGWKPSDTKGPSTLQWLGRDKSGEWKLHPIFYFQPTLHRIRWADLDGDGKKMLLTVPLQGRGTKGPDWGQGRGVVIEALGIADPPEADNWTHEVVDTGLHTTHNLQAVDFDGDGKDEVLVAGWEGVFLLRRPSLGNWTRTQLGAGNQEASPSKGSSEIKLGRLAGGGRYIATIEPWHGFQVVAYTPPRSGDGLWDRKVVDQPLAWGHAVWCADLDGDGDDELVIGQRDPNKDPSASLKGPGVRVYDPKGGPGALEFERHVVDDGGVAVEDLVVADLDGDGRGDIVAGGRATHNVKIYWNKEKK